MERPIDRSELYVCDELFFTGTAVGVAPIVRVDHRPVKDGDNWSGDACNTKAVFRCDTRTPAGLPELVDTGLPIADEARAGTGLHGCLVIGTSGCLSIEEISRVESCAGVDSLREIDIPTGFRPWIADDPFSSMLKEFIDAFI